MCRRWSGSQRTWLAAQRSNSSGSSSRGRGTVGGGDESRAAAAFLAQKGDRGARFFEAAGDQGVGSSPSRLDGGLILGRHLSSVAMGTKAAHEATFLLGGAHGARPSR